MIRFEEPEIKVVKFETPDILTMSMNASYEGVKTDHVVGGSAWEIDEEDGQYLV